jgi:nucleoside-diphosphate-sugar epimerase
MATPEGEFPRQVLVTGAAGFLGSCVVRRAVEDGLRVRGLSRRPGPAAGGVEWCRHDVRDPAGLAEALRGVDGVIHAAGLAHVFRDPDPAAFRSVNEVGTANVAEAAARAGVRHFVHVSSVAVYGPHPPAACAEGTPCRPEGPYGTSKYQAELRATRAAEAAGMPLTILRLATLYGEGDPGNVARLMRAIDRGRFLWVGAGSNRKSLLHRADAATACLVALRNPRPGVQVYNVSAPPCTMRAVVEGLAAALGRRPPRWGVPAPLARGLARLLALLAPTGRLRSLPSTVAKWLADDVYDSTRFQQAVGFRAEVDLADGLRREVEWHRRAQNEGRA